MDILFFYLDRQVRTVTNFKILLSPKMSYWMAPLLPLSALILSINFLSSNYYIFSPLLILSLLYSYLLIKASYNFLKGINIFIPSMVIDAIITQLKSFEFKDKFISVFGHEQRIDLFIPQAEIKNNFLDSKIEIDKVFFNEDFIEIKTEKLKNAECYKIINDQISIEDLMQVISFHYSNTTEIKSFSCLEKYIGRTKPKNRKSFNFKNIDKSTFYYNGEILKSNSGKCLLYNQTLKLKNKKLEIISTALQDIKNKGLIDDDLSIEDFMMVLSYCFANRQVERPILKLEINSKEVSSFLEYFFIPFLSLIGDKSNIGLISVCEYFQYKKGTNYKPVKYKSWKNR